jgi:NAD(P)-dependent dehydrogenase (short-subunit alcohol dehydrogenase family)
MGWLEERAGLAGTVAIVTGGAGGLGRQISLDLAANDVRVATVDIDGDATGTLREELARDGHDALVHHGDAREPDVLAALFAESAERWGRIDTLVNVVGGTFRAEFADTGPKGWDALLRVNLGHVLHACSLAIPRMRAGGRGGSIVNITTVEAHRAAPGFAVYGAAKAAVEHFARSLAVELGPDGIRVNNVAPDYAPTTNMLGIAGGKPAWSTPSTARIRFPMGRPGTPSDISACVVFLASNLSAYVTGTTLHPDGGTFASNGWFNWPGDGWDIIPGWVAELVDRTGPGES